MRASQSIYLGTFGWLADSGRNPGLRRRAGTILNRARLVVRAIDSALAQTYVNLDVVVVDDGSTDDTWSVLQAYRADPRIRLIRLDRNRGVTAAKNAGLAAIEGGTSYAGILDSDDSLMPDAIARLVDVFEATGDRYSQVFG